ncbi:MAG: 2-C-methyl-D-erythritol 4-phosphate cytidylyltransferase [Spirochaetaceae bacterium]|jgi:2-C-methyl-D-erythritol 4-phosphate cytidylyltransferase/2-C-methyl-D-erythritol 4-phosphate cytidylyltransferase/2-C-methyl-D-erythritol 2,4-cyclodiphosphate synthase|nr:2-C-methyl-D-erythritol 4-phosphate cytidylyltransferase [Spirochaetaceae bacterium]
MDPCIAAVITAAGSSMRMGGIKKEYLVLPRNSGTAREKDDEPLTVLGAAASAFAECGRISLIIITVPPNADNGEYAARRALPQRLLSQETPAVFFAPGGSSRRISVHHALSTLAGFKPDYVLIHDGARPWVRPALIDRVIDAVMLYDAVLPVMPLSETPKEVDGGFVRRHLKRASVVLSQTPQAFAFGPLLAAHERAARRELAESVEYTDDAQIWGEFAGPVAVIEGEKDNRKITFPEDISNHSPGS